jgi:putative phosphoribosyl transferase
MFRDRSDAGRQLATLLEEYRAEHPVVIGLPRGGVVVASEVAEALGAPMDILVVRKLGAPEHRELAIGAVVDSDEAKVLLDPDLIERLGVTREYLEQEIAREIQEIHRRESAYRAGRPPVPLEGRTVIVVDDGVATGASTRVALRAIRAKHPARVVLAVPVGSPETLRSLESEADEVIAVAAPDDFRAVGQFYEYFDQTGDEEVVGLLEQARGREKGRVEA